MTKPKREAEVTALKAIEILLERAPHVQEFEDQIKMIHAFTQDVLDGKFDIDEVDHETN